MQTRASSRLADRVMAERARERQDVGDGGNAGGGRENENALNDGSV